MSVTFGFVVIGRNEGERLSACLASLREYEAPIVYADSRSSDGSPKRAAEMGATVVELDPAGPMNAGRGRREGAERLLRDHPTLDYIQFIDGDCLLQAGWVAKALAFLGDHPRAAVACGRRFEADPKSSLFNRLCDDEWNTPVGIAGACGGDSMMRVAAYRAAGGYRADLIAGEEPELCARMRAEGWEVWRIDADMTEHDAMISRAGQWLTRSLRGGFAYAQIWTETRTLPTRAFGRQLLSSLTWAFAMPLAIVALALALRSVAWLLLIPALLALQVVRIAFRRGPTHLFSWQYAVMMMAAKFSEAVGSVRYWLNPRPLAPIEYKDSNEARLSYE